ncbi:APA family basic amino acid/polyamine antiporter [Arthrobacter stackebrandtii]|uniref:APA family basic amino acid/polyamine antiporter n=1 Tax=Arthrobacter stackebrandtii TaxID=272161 RepID=A0ABS4YXG4_9MICC|nr:amino acid permease [Arthrobacter stackebrandtii]MBP2413180.1 APA family basic amino acid/polyamine antiporter [Arthrobacter stackebrandtii]PYH01063.1 amino acid permease [Arthrobacter stackebrandtii]
MNLFRTKSIEHSLADADEPGRGLKRSLSTWDLMIMGIAVAVGAGIFSVGAEAAANHAGPAVSISFILAAVTCALAIMCYAEFATAIPVTGSAYVFTYATVGELLAWIIGWNLILELLMAASVIAKYWGIYLSNFFEAVNLDVPSHFELGPLTVYWGPLVVVAVFTFILVMGTKLAARINNVFTLIKIGIVLFVIVVGFFYVKMENYQPFVPPAQPAPVTDTAWQAQPFLSLLTGAEPSMYGFVGIISGAALVFFAFIGFDVVATSAEEVKNPSKTLPRGIFAGLAVTTVLYILVTLAVTGMVSYADLANADEPSLSTAFALVGADWAVVVISLGSLIGLTTVIMVLLMGLARVVMAMSRDGLLPRSLSKTSDKHATPARTQILSGVFVAVLAGFTPVELLSEMINIGTLSAFVMVSIGILVLRRKRPDLKPAFRVPLGPVIPVLSALLCIYLMLNLATLTWVFFAVWLAAGLVFYFSYGHWNSRLRREGPAGIKQP